MEVMVLTVRAMGGCDIILEMSVNGDETYLQGVAEALEGEDLDWVAIPNTTDSFIAYSTNYPKSVYKVVQWEALDLTP